MHDVQQGVEDVYSNDLWQVRCSGVQWSVERVEG
jgi:hypothetical protein